MNFKATELFLSVFQLQIPKMCFLELKTRGYESFLIQDNICLLHSFSGTLWSLEASVSHQMETGLDPSDVWHQYKIDDQNTETV